MGFLIKVKAYQEKKVQTLLEELPNAMIINDTPNYSILAHPNLALCITNGDPNAIMETLYFGKPPLIKFIKGADNEEAERNAIAQKISFAGLGLAFNREMTVDRVRELIDQLLDQDG